MGALDKAVLADPLRLEAVERALRTMPGSVARLDDVAGLAARLLNAPMAAVTLVSDTEEFFLGEYGLPKKLTASGRASLQYSVCKFVVSADRPVSSGDMSGELDRDLVQHLLAVEFGVRSFAGIPVRDRAGRPIGSLTVLDRRARDWTEGPDVLTTIAETLIAPGGVLSSAMTPNNGAFLSALLESLDTTVIACDDNGRIVFANRALREACGFPADGPVPQRADIMALDFRSARDQLPMRWEELPLIRALHGEHIPAADVVMQIPGQRLRIFEATAVPILGLGDRTIGAVAVAHEVTALRRAERFRACHHAVEQALRSAATAGEAAPQVLRAVAGALGWPAAELFLIDDATGSLQSVGHWDSSALEPDGFFGHHPVRGQGITGRVWETGQAIWVPDIAVSKDLRTPYERERVEICLKHGVRTALAVPVRDGGTLLGVLTCYANTQEYEPDLLTVLLDGVAAQIGVFVAQRHVEELARQLSRAQSDFVDLVGHELRTPLTSITANATMLAEEPGLDADCRQMARVIARNAASLQLMADTLLDLAGLDSGHLQLDVRRIDLSGLVADAVAASRRAGNHPLVAELPSELYLPADEDRLRQVVDDLLSNALRYSPAGAPVRVTLQVDGTMAELCIIDNGIGTPATERARVFDRFFRGSNVRHQGTTGSGLGLSLARAIVLLHGGTIRLEENRPSGTLVRVRLPLAGRAQGNPQVPEPVASRAVSADIGRRSDASRDQ